MRRRSTNCKGTTLAEILVAVVLLGSSSSVVIGAVSAAHAYASYSQERARVLSMITSEIEIVRGTMVTSLPLTTAGTTNSVTVPGISSPISVTRKVILLAGYTRIYEVEFTANWTAYRGINSKPTAEVMTLGTFVRAIDGEF